MRFETEVDGQPCQCEVIHYQPEAPARITGTGFGDADPPEESEFDYRLLDSNGEPAPHLEDRITPSDELRIFTEYLNQLVYH